jgi:hypothetical protein
MRGRGRAIGVVVLGAVLAGCDAGSDAPAASEPAPATNDVATTTAPARADATTTETTTETTTTTIASAPTSSAGEPIATVPEQGVPGIDSEDPFCRAWSEFAGSFQALAFASALDAANATEREVLAAAAVVDAARTLDETFPDPVVAERELFVDEVIGPFARRAARAVAELRSVGVADDGLSRLAAVWLSALATTDAEDREVAIETPADLADAVAAAATSFAEDVPPIVADPSLITDADAPATFGYIAEQCPDQGILSGNDAIG